MIHESETSRRVRVDKTVRRHAPSSASTPRHARARTMSATPPPPRALNNPSSSSAANYARCAAKKRAQDGALVLPFTGKDWFGSASDGRGVRVGAVVAVYCVFDGHKDASAMAFLEANLGKNLEREFRGLGREDDDASLKGGDVEGASSNGMRRGGLERAVQRALDTTEREYGRSNNAGCFLCWSAAPEGGATVTISCLQRVEDDKDGAPAYEILTANVGDSGALLLPCAEDFGGAVASRRDAHLRLTRDHGPDDPFEARRLLAAECRLARLRGPGGAEVGPLRVFPGGYAISRAFGDFDCPALICEAEFTRVKIPRSGCRLFMASDGVYGALSDATVATECSKYDDLTAVVEGVVGKVLQVRGLHDDITAVVVDIPGPEQLTSHIKQLAPFDGDVACVTLHNLKAKQLDSKEKESLVVEDDLEDVTVHPKRVYGDFSSAKLDRDFDVQELLGRGVYGSVRRAVDRKSGETVAVKSILRQKVQEYAIKDECDALQVLCGHHPNFPSIFSVYEDAAVFKSEVTHIVTDLYEGGTLLDAIQKRGRFDEGDWCVIANQLLGAVSFMHSLGVCHRDLKPDNIMLDKPWSSKAGSIPTLKIIDFGSATFCMAHETLRGHAGTKFFSAPEVLKRKPYTKKCDVWSVGVLLMTLLKGYPSGIAVEGQWKALQQGLAPTFSEQIPRHFVKLIHAALTFDQSKRPSCASILRAADSWLGAAYTNNNILASPQQLRAARKLAIPKNFNDTLRLHDEISYENVKQARKSSFEDISFKGSQEEEDISVHKGNSWQLDLQIEERSGSSNNAELDLVEHVVDAHKVNAYQRYVVDMLSVMASPTELREILTHLRKEIAGRKNDEHFKQRPSMDDPKEHTWCTAEALENAAKQVGAMEVFTQLELARRLTEMDAESLSLDIQVLSGLDSMHERHMHVFSSFAHDKAAKESPTKSHTLDVAELSAVDGSRVTLDSGAHAEMVRSMMSRGLSAYDLQKLEQVSQTEPSDLTVRGGSAWFFEDWSNSGSRDR
jgi:calcium/calmodulin-dependent protein kinase I